MRTCSGCEPKSEVPGGVLDQKPDEAFMHAERRSMNADRHLIDIVATLVSEIEPALLGEIY